MTQSRLLGRVPVPKRVAPRSASCTESIGCQPCELVAALLLPKHCQDVEWPGRRALSNCRTVSDHKMGPPCIVIEFQKDSPWIRSRGPRRLQSKPHSVRTMARLMNNFTPRSSEKTLVPRPELSGRFVAVPARCESYCAVWHTEGTQT